VHKESHGRKIDQALELIMVVRRRTWLYRLAGQMYAQLVSFDRPLTSASARIALRRSVGNPLELWGRDKSDIVHLYRRQ
jgi:hypothetical protein